MSSFCDQTIVGFIGGKGGDGAVSFRREKHVPRGGPDGGDGGNGASIIMQTDVNLNTLVDYANKKLYRAEDGGNGRGNNSTGRNGTELVLKVPVGTIIFDNSTGEKLADLNKPGQKFTVVKGGKGGVGNARFKSSIHQAPKFAEIGEEGEQKTILLELQLVADIGIIGYPSAGKSTLISRISNARPKIADYPFTTLVPNLGVIDMSKFDKRMKDSFVVADIPGLISGAHKGKGLGHKFLKHIARTEALVHLIDPTRESPQDFLDINKELKAFDQKLASKHQIVAISKVDIKDNKQIEKLKKELIKLSPDLKDNVLPISSVSGEGIKQLVFLMYEQIKKIREARAKDLKADELMVEAETEKIFKPHLKQKKWTIVFRRSKKEAESGKTRKIFDISGERIEQVVKMTDLNNGEGLERIYHFMKRMGIKKELITMGAQTGDRLRIAGKTIIMRS